MYFLLGLVTSAWPFRNDVFSCLVVGRESKRNARKCCTLFNNQWEPADIRDETTYKVDTHDKLRLGAAARTLYLSDRTTRTRTRGWGIGIASLLRRGRRPAGRVWRGLTVHGSLVRSRRRRIAGAWRGRDLTGGSQRGRQRTGGARGLTNGRGWRRGRGKIAGVAIVTGSVGVRRRPFRIVEGGVVVHRN